MQFVYGWLVGAVMGGAAIWIYKSHLQHEADKLKAAAQKAVPRI